MDKTVFEHLTVAYSYAGSKPWFKSPPELAARVGQLAEIQRTPRTRHLCDVIAVAYHLNRAIEMMVEPTEAVMAEMATCLGEIQAIMMVATWEQEQEQEPRGPGGMTADELREWLDPDNTGLTHDQLLAKLQDLTKLH